MLDLEPSPAPLSVGRLRNGFHREHGTGFMLESVATSDVVNS